MSHRRPLPDCFPDVENALPAVAQGDTASSGRFLARMLSAAIEQAEALGLRHVAAHLGEALTAAERHASRGAAAKDD